MKMNNPQQIPALTVGALARQNSKASEAREHDTLIRPLSDFFAPPCFTGKVTRRSYLVPLVEEYYSDSFNEFLDP